MVFLVGYMYSGKTTVARQLAQYLSVHHGVEVDVVDTDEALENRYHITVTDCFRRYGESMFRTLESTVLKQLSACPHGTIKAVGGQQQADTNVITQSHNNAITIVSTGGGTPCFNDNMQWMLDHGLTLYLKLDESIILRRMAASRNVRPSIAQLTPDERARFVHEQLQNREPFYNRAHVVYDGIEPDIAAIAQKILESLSSVQKGSVV